jgi:hypothetical protein
MLFSAVVGRLHSTCCCTSKFYDSRKMPLSAPFCTALGGCAQRFLVKWMVESSLLFPQHGNHVGRTFWSSITCNNNGSCTNPSIYSEPSCDILYLLSTTSCKALLVQINHVGIVSPSFFSQQHMYDPGRPQRLIFSSQLQPAAHGTEDATNQSCKHSHSSNHH